MEALLVAGTEHHLQIDNCLSNLQVTLNIDQVLTQHILQALALADQGPAQILELLYY